MRWRLSFLKVLPPISDDEKMLAGLPYVVWPVGSAFILLSRKREEPFLHYHAVQALAAGGVLAVALLALMLGLFLTFRVMPGSAQYGGAVLGMTVMLGGGTLLMGVLLTALFLGWRATEGEMLRLPIIGDFAEEKMLDMTGMTRRQFETMLEASLQPIKDEEIPFPEVNETEETSTVSPTTDRLEAMRQAREQKYPAPPSASEPSATKRTNGPQQPAQTSQAAQGYRPPPARATPEPRPAAPARPSTPKVREVDLIGHYKETKVDSSPKADVLRQWLSSMDE